MIKSFVSNKTEIKQSSTDGVGTFAKEKIRKGEVIFIRGGHILTRDTVFYYNKIDGYWPIDDYYVLGAKDEKEFKYVKIYVNHSCEPNCGMRGEITGVAMRDIKAGEEITMDYAMLDNEEHSFECNCGSASCRHIITGYDWKIKELQKKYNKYFASYLREKFENDE